MDVTITPYDDNFNKPKAVIWLKEDNISTPLDAPFGHYPKPIELKEVLNTFADCRVEYKVTPIHWMAEIVCGESRVSIIVAFSGGECDPFDYLSFTGNYEDILLVVKRLSQICGTFILLHDGEAPVLILPEGLLDA